MPMIMFSLRRAKRRWGDSAVHHRKERGFTLIELLIALTILAVVIVVIFGSFRMGVRAWEKGEGDIEERQKQRIVLDLIRRQLSSICTEKILTDDGKTFQLVGDEEKIAFVSHTAVLPSSKYGAVYVTYEIGSGDDDENVLYLYEKSAVLLKGKVPDYPDEDDWHTLLGGFHEIVFEYLKEDKKNDYAEWQKTWDSEQDDGFPKAIRLALAVKEDAAPLFILASITESK